MIESIGASLTGTLAGTPASSSSGGFDAALAAARKDEARKQALQGDLDAIRDKGFSAWARDTQIEALKEKLRKQVMAEMGVDEQSLSGLSSVMQDILRKKIEEEVDKRMQEETAKEDGTATRAGPTQTAAAQPGKDGQGGKDCPVIPALSWPGAASLF